MKEKYSSYEDTRHIVQQGAGSVWQAVKMLFQSFANKEIRRKIWTPQHIIFTVVGCGIIALYVKYVLPLFELLSPRNSFFVFLLLLAAMIYLNSYDKKKTGK